MREGGPGMTATPDLAELEQRTLATERLLSTLIALLSARDPHLLEELQAVFVEPDFGADDAGRSASETWRRIRSELKDTGRLIQSLGDRTSG
jgi:hypothetical protein